MKALVLFVSLFWGAIVFAENTLVIDFMHSENDVTVKLENVSVKDESIILKGADGTTCVLPFKHLVDPRVLVKDCEDAVSVPAESRKELTDLFKNAKNAVITCNLEDAKVVGFQFTGRSTVNGEETLAYKGRVFSMEPFAERDKRQKEADNASMKKFLGSVFKVVEYLVLPPVHD